MLLIIQENDILAEISVLNAFQKQKFLRTPIYLDSDGARTLWTALFPKKLIKMCLLICTSNIIL